MMTATATAATKSEKSKLLKRVGVVGFWFFFIKGLAWLAAPVFFYFVMQGA